jgi:hypothetical protein
MIGMTTKSHSSAVSDDGRQLHQHDFKVHTGHTELPGHSDSSHFEHGGDHDRELASEGIPPSRHLSKAAWQRMANSLSDLQSSGFDIGECENYLPMIERETIHPSMEAEVFHFYKHLLRRLEPDSRSSEPVEVVEAALGFVEGYEELKGLQNSVFPNK